MASPIVFNGIASTYTENFDSLSRTPGSLTNDLVLPGWQMSERAGDPHPGDNGQYGVDDGSRITGDTYSYGSTGSTDRALGTLQDGKLHAMFGVDFFNDNAFAVLDTLTVSYTGEQWRLGHAGRGPDRLDFQYSLDATSLTDGTWTDFDALDFVSPNTTGAEGATDGNAAGFRTDISATITGLNFGPFQHLFVRWVDAHITNFIVLDTDVMSPEDGLAIDDLSVATLSAASVNAPPVNTVPNAVSAVFETDSAINGLSIADPNAPSFAFMSTTLSVLHGTLTFATNGGAFIESNGSDTVTLRGTLSEINAALTAHNNLIYHGAAGFSGPDTLTMVTNDGGLVDLYDPQTDTDQVTIHVIQYDTVFTTQVGTPGDDTFAAPLNVSRINALGGHDTVTFGFRLVDATVKYDDNTVIVDGPSSHTVLTGVERFVFTDGTVDNSDANRLLDDLFYYARNHDVWNAHVDADAHYAQFGAHEGRDPNAWFDARGYLATYADVRAAGVDPLEHYLTFGWKEGRDPSVNFDTTAYLAANPDVAAAGINPLRHYLEFGIAEGRSAHGDGIWG